MIDCYEYSIPELLTPLGARFKDYRLRSNMTQKDVSEQSGITIFAFHGLLVLEYHHIMPATTTTVSASAPITFFAFFISFFLTQR